MRGSVTGSRTINTNTSRISRTRRAEHCRKRFTSHRSRMEFPDQPYMPIEPFRDRTTIERNWKPSSSWYNRKASIQGLGDLSGSGCTGSESGTRPTSRFVVVSGSMPSSRDGNTILSVECLVFLSYGWEWKFPCVLGTLAAKNLSPSWVQVPCKSISGDYLWNGLTLSAKPSFMTHWMTRILLLSEI